jgi:hypothetical protein
VVKQNLGSACIAQKKILDKADRAQVTDPEVYGAGASLSTDAELEPGVEIEEMSDDIDVLSTLAGISHIGLNSDCQCYYENEKDTDFKARWPALESHCESYFSEYLNLPSN